MWFLEIITNETFIQLLSTLGLAVVVVLYFVLVRDPKQAKCWRQRYDKLTENYDRLSENYIRLENDLRPESRMCREEQARNLVDLGLDRDLYKLYYYMCAKLDSRRLEDVCAFVEESISATNEAWSKFKSPFMKVPRIGDLYGIYTNSGESLKLELEEILKEKIPDEEKKAKVWNLLFTNTVNMKREFQELLQSLSNGKEVSPYDTVQFSAYYPHAIQPNHQYSVYLYAHLQGDRGAIEDDIKRCKTKLGGKISKPKTAKRSAQIKRGTPITVVPECDDIEFSPGSLTKKWYGNRLRFDFDFQPTEDLCSQLLFVRLSVQVYGVEISHIKCAIEVVEQAGQSAPVVTDPENPLAAAKLESRIAMLYQKIFFSYSREDKRVAEAFRFAQIAVGNKVFMDTYSIRTGANWRAALAGAIDESDIFQLFWSKNSAASSNVRDEWQYALKYKCPKDRCIDFIRPVYWEEPIRPDPPTELSHLNFRYVPRLAVT